MQGFVCDKNYFKLYSDVHRDQSRGATGELNRNTCQKSELTGIILTFN